MQVKAGSAPRTTGLIIILAVVLALCLPSGTAAAQRADARTTLAVGAGYALADGSGKVRSLQRRLRALGERPGPVDGLFGPLTEAAVVRLQGRTGIVADGIVGSQTRVALRRAGPQPLRRGSGYATSDGSQRVRALQRALRRRGHSPGPIDGKFGPQTEAAVRRLQAERRLSVDGVADARTLATLDAPRRDARPAEEPRTAQPDRPAASESPAAKPSPPAPDRRPAAAPSPAPVADGGLPQVPIAIALVLLALGAIWLATRRTSTGDRYEKVHLARAEARPAVAGHNGEVAGHTGNGGKRPSRNGVNERSGNKVNEGSGDKVSERSGNGDNERAGNAGNGRPSKGVNRRSMKGANGRSGNGASHAPLGTLLRKRGAVSQDAVEGALAEQRQTGGRLGEILVTQGAVDREALQLALAEQMDLPSFVRDYQAVPALPYEVARRERAAVLAGPTGATEGPGPVLVAVGDIESVPAIASVLERPVEPRLTDPMTLDELLTEAYSGPRTAKRDTNGDVDFSADERAGQMHPSRTLLIPLRLATVSVVEELSRKLERIADPAQVFEAIVLVDVADRTTRRALRKHALPARVTVQLVPHTTARSRAAALIFGLERARAPWLTVVHPEAPLPEDLFRAPLAVDDRAPVQGFLADALADPANPSPAPTLYRTSDLRVGFGWTPLEPPATPALVQIDWSAEEGEGRFGLLSLDGRVGDPASPCSPTVRFEGNGELPRTDAVSRAHAMLYDRLVLTGWEPAGRGREWYAHRFRRPAG